MNKITALKSRNSSFAKYLCALSLATFALTALAEPKPTDTWNNNLSVEGSNPVIANDDKKGKETDPILLTCKVLPQYPGGQIACKEYLRNRIKYPTSALKAKKEGRCLVKFVIEKDGSISNEQILRSSGTKALDKEALRVISKMPKWTPGKEDGKAVRVQLMLPILFKL